MSTLLPAKPQAFPSTRYPLLMLQCSCHVECSSGQNSGQLLPGCFWSTFLCPPMHQRPGSLHGASIYPDSPVDQGARSHFFLCHVFLFHRGGHGRWIRKQSQLTHKETHKICVPPTMFHRQRALRGWEAHAAPAIDCLDSHTRHSLSPHCPMSQLRTWPQPQLRASR